MRDEDQYVPRPEDMVIFDRPPPQGGQSAGEGLGAQTLLVVQPGLPGSGSITLRQARELLGSERAREAVAAALASVPGLPASAGSAAAEPVLRAIAELLPPEQGT